MGHPTFDRGPRSNQPMTDTAPTTASSGLEPCPYCGEAQQLPAGGGEAGRRCSACRGFLDPLSLDASRQQMGDWQIRDADRPFRPGCDLATLRRLASRGGLSPESIIRGPSTQGFWTRAAVVPGVSHLVGRCYSCHAPAHPDHAACERCGSVFLLRAPPPTPQSTTGHSSTAPSASTVAADDDQACVDDVATAIELRRLRKHANRWRSRAVAAGLAAIAFALVAGGTLLVVALRAAPVEAKGDPPTTSAAPSGTPESGIALPAPQQSAVAPASEPMTADALADDLARKLEAFATIAEGGDPAAIRRALDELSASAEESGDARTLQLIELLRARLELLELREPSTPSGSGPNPAPGPG